MFDISGRFRNRERQRIELKNVWLKRRGLPTVVLPSYLQVQPSPQETIQPLLAEFEQAKRPAERQSALRQLESVGMSALPAIFKHLGTRNPEQAGYSEMKAVAIRLSLTVQEIQFSDDSVCADADDQIAA